MGTQEAKPENYRVGYLFGSGETGWEYGKKPHFSHYISRYSWELEDVNILHIPGVKSKQGGSTVEAHPPS